jgi:ABC-type phosphate/phosphonate transport system substrate-binding protein
MNLKFLLFIALSLFLAHPLMGQPEDPVMEEQPETVLFRIGFQRWETTGHPSGRYLEQLRTALEEDEKLQNSLKQGGYNGIGLFPCDGPFDMLRRLNAREFDLAFSPANIYARQETNYTAVLKARRPEDSIAPNDKVWRRGVVFITPRCPLFDEEEISSGALSLYLGQQRMAVVSTQSVAGFQAPLLRLAVDYNIIASEGGYLWFDSSEEAVKGVISGLADIGACDEPALNRVLKKNGLEEQRDQLVRIILHTDPIPTDPVILREGLSPRQSALGRELVQAINAFAREGGFGEIRYSIATDQEYRAVVDLNKEFNERVGEVAR